MSKSRASLANSLEAYVNGKMSNWELQDAIEHNVGTIPEPILEQIDLLYDDFPEKYIQQGEEFAEVAKVLMRISQFLLSEFEYVRKDVSSDGYWPFTRSQYQIL